MGKIKQYEVTVELRVVRTYTIEATQEGYDHALEVCALSLYDSLENDPDNYTFDVTEV